MKKPVTDLPSGWHERHQEWGFGEGLSTLPLLYLHALLDGLYMRIEERLAWWFDNIPLIADTVRPNFRRGDNLNGNGLVAFQRRVGRMGSGMPSTVVHALTWQAGKGDSAPCVAGPKHGVRRLTPLECERLQGFPDIWTAPFSDSVRYRMLGNAVPVPVAQWLGKRIRRFLKS